MLTAPEWSKQSFSFTCPKASEARTCSTRLQAKGAAIHLVAAFDPSFKDRSGAFLHDCQIATAAGLWVLGENLVGEKFDFNQTWEIRLAVPEIVHEGVNL